MEKGETYSLIDLVQRHFLGRKLQLDLGERENRAGEVLPVTEEYYSGGEELQARTPSRQRRAALQKLTCGQTPGRAGSCWLGHSRGVLYLEGDRAVPCYPPG